MEVIKSPIQLTLTLNEEEIRYLQGITQNPMVEPNEEDPRERELRLATFVVMSRALGYAMNDDGSIVRSK